ncbi:hypothetical protein DBZ36_01325 [Alginatibacterium sediminis]|uniref:Uncharacterized protein n=1 Tax=Alginatibacterium sediminis TaxID=2164068 RepID=A0A420EKW7_9ALTE|nr:hypothetical protein DBZ36_01325 [Alginatibacterium sediminis]
MLKLIAKMVPDFEIAIKFIKNNHLERNLLFGIQNKVFTFCDQCEHFVNCSLNKSESCARLIGCFRTKNARKRG